MAPRHSYQTNEVPYPKYSLSQGLCDGPETQCGYVGKFLMTWNSNVYVLETWLSGNAPSLLCKIPHAAQF